jgi:hypothetical protein
MEAVFGSEVVEFGNTSDHARLAPPDAEYLTTVTLADSQMIQLVDPTKLPQPFEAEEE